MIKTDSRLTKYEKARILGIRALQLSRGAPPMISVTTNLTHVMDIAEEELKQNKLPFIIRRPLPNGKYVDVAVNDLIYDDLS